MHGARLTDGLRRDRHLWGDVESGRGVTSGVWVVLAVSYRVFGDADVSDVVSVRIGRWTMTSTARSSSWIVLNTLDASELEGIPARRYGDVCARSGLNPSV